MYESITSLENLFNAWEEFLKGKRKRKDIAEFSENLSENIYNLHHSLKTKTYTHGGYQAFNISDPKPRNIHKASVRDRLLHHAVYRVLYPHFDKKFIGDSYSCRVNKGTHRAINQFQKHFYKVSKNNTKQCFVLKCDIKKFFATIDHQTLLWILTVHIEDKDILWLLNQIISSFSSSVSKAAFDIDNSGLPLGNLTSQLLVNIYMDELDQYVKHKLKAKYSPERAGAHSVRAGYIRYADDFTMIYHSRAELEKMLSKVKDFLENNLKLQVHPDKVFIKTLSSGVDFLGWVHFPTHRALRTATKRRMIKNIEKVSTWQVDTLGQTKASYLGMLKYGNAYKVQKEVLEL